MPIERVSDAEDPRLQPFAGLKTRGPDGRVVVEGEIAVARALASRHPVDALLLTPGHRERLGDAIDPSLMVYEAEAALVREVVGFDFHRGCLAVMPRPVAPSLEALGRGVLPGPALAVVAEALADPVNVGALIRNAAAFGALAVVLVGGADPWSRRAIRASMGLSFSFPVIRCEEVGAAVDELRRAMGETTRTVAAVVQSGAVALPDYRPAWRTVLLVGNEGAGLSSALRAQADDAVTIPIAPGVDSLNVAAATAVLLWTLRWASR